MVILKTKHRTCKKKKKKSLLSLCSTTACLAASAVYVQLRDSEQVFQVLLRILVSFMLVQQKQRSLRTMVQSKHRIWPSGLNRFCIALATAATVTELPAYCIDTWRRSASVSSPKLVWLWGSLAVGKMC